MSTYRKTSLEEIEVRSPLIASVPLVIDDWTLAFQLGFTGRVFWYIVRHREDMYEEHLIPKKTGGVRKIFDPNGLLRVFQERLRTRILKPLVSQLGEHVAAYQLGRSTVDAASAHLRACPACEADTQPGMSPTRHVCLRRGVKFKMDLKDFFLSTTRSMIRGYFHNIVGYNHHVSSLLGQLMTTDYWDNKQRLRNGVPPGALIAGDICNLVCDWKVDQPVLALLAGLPGGWRYTRYADDLYFSSDVALPDTTVNSVIRRVAEVIGAAGYRVNWRKLQVQHWRRPQRVLGININRKLNIPAPEFRRMHHLLYKAGQVGFDAQVAWAKKEDTGKLHSWILGKLNYFQRFAPEKTAKLRKLYAKALDTQCAPKTDETIAPSSCLKTAE
jgi:RNA-directed DNA polymerase